MIKVNISLLDVMPFYSAQNMNYCFSCAMKLDAIPVPDLLPVPALALVPALAPVPSHSILDLVPIPNFIPILVFVPIPGLVPSIQGLVPHV
jgi:hypothetical protein